MNTLKYPYNEAAYLAFSEHWHAHMDMLGVPHVYHVDRETPHMNIDTNHLRNGLGQYGYDENDNPIYESDVTLIYNQNDQAECALAQEFARAFEGV